MLSNYSEFLIGSDPEDPDFDRDGILDGVEVSIGTSYRLIDTDGDNFHDRYEYDYGSDPLDPNDFPKIWKNDFDTLMKYLSQINGTLSGAIL